MNSGPVILQLMSPASNADSLVCADKFADHGLVVTPCSSLVELTERIWLLQGKPDARIVILLESQGAGDAPTVSALRALRTNLGIVALVRPGNEAGIIQLLHTGVDVHCRVDASPDLLVAIVLRLVWRLGLAPYSLPSNISSPVPGQQSASWRLVDQGWALRSPAGHCITLTTGERAFLTTLLNAPAWQATHALLIDAVNAAYNNSDGQTHQSRLGVMVSRMRRKFTQAGAPLPLKSIHNWGYMFAMDE